MRPTIGGSLRGFALALCAAVALTSHAQEASALRGIGRGMAIVFSPDVTTPANCALYERLGFVCYQTPSWQLVVDDIACRNRAAAPADATSVLIVEAHGTNGNGLQLQASGAKRAPRSYIAAGALSDRLAAAGVRYCVLAACNARRLLRPAVYDHLDAQRGGALPPPTLGIINRGSDARADGVRFLTRADSHVESLSLGSTGELSAATRRALGLPKGMPFVVSDMLVQLLTNDPALDLRLATPTEQLKLATPEDRIADRLFARFVAHLDALARDREDDRATTLVASLRAR
jgi:hypothetical protein